MIQDDLSRSIQRDGMKGYRTEGPADSGQRRGGRWCASERAGRYLWRILIGANGRLVRCLFLCLASMLLPHCRMTRDSGTPQATRASSLSVKSDNAVPQTGLQPFREDGLEDVVWVSANSYPGAPTELQGFDAQGEIRCLPLKDAASCLKTPNPWRDRCLAKGGVIKRCQDCREVCDKPFDRH